MPISGMNISMIDESHGAIGVKKDFQKPDFGE
jgi:hypothetical protein